MVVFNPNAAVIVYNYIDRQGSYKLDEKSRDEVEKIVLTNDIVSIQTRKEKSQPAGSFEIVLAPTKNWTATLTPGSWLSIHMSPYNKDKTSSDIEDGLLSYGPSTLKMVGRIDTVQMSVGVRGDGSRATSFVVSGKDWGQAFETILYIDPMASVSSDSPIEQLIRFGFDAELKEKGGKFLTTTNIINVFIKIWGTQNKELVEDVSTIGNKISNVDRLIPSTMYHLPKELSESFALMPGFQAFPKSMLVDNMVIKTGRLTSEDKYRDELDTGGPINTGSIIGGNTVWQVLYAHSGSVVNEMFTDLRWEGPYTQLAFYKRVRPFLLKEDEETMHGKQVSSSFFKLKRIDIDTNQVIAVQAGTNWRDRYNFVEVLPQYGPLLPGYEFNEPLTKIAGNSAYDPISFGRDGFKPLLFYTPYLPFTPQGMPGNPQDMNQWIPVLQDWYFNTHKMLNGTVSISNQEEYISVGQNISLSGNLFSSSHHVKGDSKEGLNIKLLAHVETVENNFMVDPESGARNFYTNVSFVRGIFTDNKCKSLFVSGKGTGSGYGVDSKANALSKEDVLISNVAKVDHG